MQSNNEIVLLNLGCIWYLTDHVSERKFIIDILKVAGSRISNTLQAIKVQNLQNNNHSKW